MKQFIWMLCGIFLSGLLLGTLSACGADQYDVTFVTTGQPSNESSAPAEKPVPAEEGGGEETPPDSSPDAGGAVQDEDTARRTAYGKVLWDAYQQGLLPDGTQLDWTDSESAAKNKFALADVDGDGKDELILYWTQAIMAGQLGEVYAYSPQTDTVRLELSEFPDLTFYDNGTVLAGWSHNQGWGGQFWPYSVYQFQPGTRDFVMRGAVDAWDRSCTDENRPGLFPLDIDADGDGLVYFLLSGEWPRTSRTAPDGSVYETWAADPVDGDAYEAWEDFFIDGALETGVSFQELTEENIAALGCPKPSYTPPEPKG